MNLVLPYLCAFNRGELQHLYSHRAVTRAVFRSLGALAQQYAMRILFTSDATTTTTTMPDDESSSSSGQRGVPLSSVERWVADTATPEHERALRRLLELGVAQLRESRRAPGTSLLVLTDVFARALAADICEPAPVPPPPLAPFRLSKLVAALDAHAQSRWEALVGLLVGVPGVPPSDQVVQLMLTSGLLRLTASDSLKISNQGFQFLLQAKPAQLWTLLLAHLELLPSDTHRRHLLSLLFRIGALPVGSKLTRSTIADEHADVGVEAIEILDGLGLVQWDASVDAVFVGPLAASLIGAADAAAEEGFIVLETNYRLYAYTSSPIDIAVICLFTQPLTRLPNLVVGIVTRDSIRQALMAGITADQILAYLQLKAHPALIAENTAAVPIAVSEQISLWATERARVHCNRAALYTFPDDALFQRAVAEAQRTEVHLYNNPARRVVVVLRTTGEAVMRELFRNA
jgi:transcription initiation factor TFIIH subunit 4